MCDTHGPPTRTPNLVGTRQRLMQLMPTFLLSSSPFMQTQSQTLAEVSSDQGIRTSRWSARRDSSLTALYYERYIKSPVLWAYHRKAQDRKMKCCRGRPTMTGRADGSYFNGQGIFTGGGIWVVRSCELTICSPSLRVILSSVSVPGLWSPLRPGEDGTGGGCQGWEVVSSVHFPK